MIKRFVDTINQFNYDSDWQVGFIVALVIIFIIGALIVIANAFFFNIYIGWIVLLAMIYSFLKFLYLKAKSDI